MRFTGTKVALARGEVPCPHVKRVKTPLKETHLAKSMPIYQRLASNELLQRCIRCVTQNANESLHSIIWGKMFKNKRRATLRRVTIAVCDAVCEFNLGTKRIIRKFAKGKWALLQINSQKYWLFGETAVEFIRGKEKRLAVYAIARKKLR
ncbi:uncharacterized protein TNCV_3642651 [Trichonephila clavipes]|nr:uncharacterized protein TNCV_3642651 [Trichonephila clavipes]